ncbi:transglutaminase-like domain-containing protein [Microbulbifer magnicolonia]|uniref:transglutaminase-like domain-containing protein n=1 Tax=Microbulbifer magnicolonia TaxID=3109744 RepID=UPI002B414C30|nr:transglutaminase domain-containing protein [Microbulbifer sp. GG15]
MTDLALDRFRKGVGAKGAAAITAFIFSFVFYFSPASKAVADEINRKDERLARIEQLKETTTERKLAHRLQKLKAKVVRQLPEAIARREAGKGWWARSLDSLGFGDMGISDAELVELEELRRSVMEAWGEAEVELSQSGEQLARRHLPAVATDRHQKATRAIRDGYRQLQERMDKLLFAESGEEREAARQQLTEFLQEQQFQRRHTPVDPQRLPWGSADRKVRPPLVDGTDLQASLGLDPYDGPIQLAASELTPLMLAGALSVSQPTDAHLAETPDIAISDAMRELAASLDNSPTEIYAWVHNNIRFVPSYGSIQGAAHTLETLRGNAMDTASLLIGLLRAAGIPARYAYGTVDIPVEQVTNWVGGVTTPDAALNLLGQGGIPSIGLIQNGVVTHIRLEHAWAEAWVDFEPSRGVKNRQGDNWIPMDASFKQYEFSPGMDVQQAVPFDTQGLIDEISANATVDEAAGWVQNLPQGAVETKLADFQQQLQTYIEAQNPEATVGEVLGLQEVKIIPAGPLSAGLPYRHIATQTRFAEVPDRLRHKFRYILSTSFYGQAGSEIVSLLEPTVKLAGKKLAVSFSPATEDDQAIIDSYLPEPDPETGEIDPAQMPDTLPGYLIHLKAEISLDGEVSSEGGAGTMGGELHESLALWSPKDGWNNSTNHPTAGEYRAIGLDLQSISPERAARLQASVEQTKAVLESGDDAQLATLTKHELVGDLIYGTIFSYFALNDVQDQIQAQSSNIVTYRLPSYGIFSTGLQTHYWFGTPRNVSFDGLNMDVDLMYYQTAAQDNDQQKVIAFHQAAGARSSAMEHLVPEQMFSTPEAPAQGISAVKALAIASAEGQKIWTVTQSNLDIALSSIQLDAETEAEIRQSVLAGKVATAHELPISFNGWIGEGYLLIDPQTGAGAFKISGGNNGGDLLSAIGALLGLAGVAVTVGEFLESLVGLGTLFAKIGAVLGPLAVLLSVVDAKLSGCGAGASLGIFGFSLAAWAGMLALSFYALPLLIILLAIIAISLVQFIIVSGIKEDFCDA